MISVEVIEYLLYKRQLALSVAELAAELAVNLREESLTFSVERIALDRIRVTYYA